MRGRWIALALLGAGCNGLLGVEDVTLANDAGDNVPDGGNSDAPVDAPIDADNTLRVGADQEFGGQTDVLANFDLAREIQVMAATNLIGLGVITKAAGGAGGQLRLGLYEDSGAGEPANFVARSGVVADFPLGETVATISPVALPAGTYWIAVAFNADTPVGADAANLVTSCFQMRASFGSTIPASGFGAGPTCNTAEQLNLFIVVEN